MLRCSGKPRRNGVKRQSELDTVGDETKEPLLTPHMVVTPQEENWGLKYVI